MLTSPSFMEGARLRAVIGLFRETTRPMDIVDGEAKHHVGPGQRIACNLVSSLSQASESQLLLSVTR